MTSNRNAIADYLSYTLISTGENINLRFIDNEIWANLIQISKIYDEDEMRECGFEITEYGLLTPKNIRIDKK